MGATWWGQDRVAASFAPLTGDARCDVVIVGAGITGLTAALRLARAGRKVIVIEADRVGGGTTGHSSAHLTVETDTDLDQLRSRVGDEAAGAAVRANRAGIDRIAALDAEMGGAGRFGWVPGWLWTDDRSELDRLVHLAALYQRYGESAEAGVAVPLPGDRRGMRLDAQAMFHPIHYLQGLAALATGAGVTIHEHTAAIDWDSGAPVTVQTRSGTVTATELILATHTPPGVVPSVQTRMASYLSFLVVVRPNRPIPAGLYWDMADPYHYLRPLDDGAWLVGGEDLPPGTGDPAAALDRLAAWARDTLDAGAPTHRWDHMWFEPADGMPYVGRLPLRAHTWVATGLSGTGLTWGTWAGEAIADAIVADTDVDALFSPSRLRPVGSADRVAKDQAEVAWHFVADRLRPTGDHHPADLARGEGRLLTIDGEKLGVYRDDLGALHAVRPVCRHLGCVVGWNAVDRTWDCPCHGGRYRADGTRFWGPPMSDLEKRRIDDDALPLAE
ncbi:MAG: FAD-dependent oxidoreductase [Myxococcota bacterium]